MDAPLHQICTASFTCLETIYIYTVYMYNVHCRGLSYTISEFHIVYVQYYIYSEIICRLY